MTVDAIYRARNLKYVSSINFAASVIKYSLARSKTIIDIDNHIISSGSYTKFTNWLESLAIEQQSLPKGFLFLAFDNEQKGQKNYLDRGYNMVVFHTVMSFVAFIIINIIIFKLILILGYILSLPKNNMKIYYV